MGELWLALLLVATLGSVDPAASAISVGSIKTAWETFKPTSVPAEIDTCDKSPTSCDSAQVDPDAGGVDVGTLCTAIGTYSTCAGGCSLTDTQKQQLEAVEDLCKTVASIKTAWETFKPTSVPAEITTCDQSPTSCNSAQVDPNAVGVDLDTLCTAVDTYFTCAGACSLTDDQKQQLEAVKDLCKTVGLEKAVADITTGGNCDTATCPTTDVDSASGLNAKCMAFYTYSSCAKGKCSSTLTAGQNQALQDMEDQCKTAELEAAVVVIKGKCSQCDGDASPVDSASGLDDKCKASQTYLACVIGASCTTDPDADVEALKTLCPDTTSTSTSTKTSTDATAKAAATTRDPADVVNDAWETFKQSSPTCDTNCSFSDANTDVGSSDLTIICQTVRDYTGCAVAKCGMSETDPLLVALTEPCPDDGGDDGCSILQVSTLALMLSLLLSII